MSERLDEFVSEPDVNEWGLPCCCASLLMSFWHGDASGVQSWAENMAHRLWLPIVWDDRYSLRACGTHPGFFASASARALAHVGVMWPEEGAQGFDDGFGACMREVADILALDGGLGRGDGFGWLRSGKGVLMLPAGYDADEMCSLASVMRCAWLARLHERNGRFDPELDWQDVRRQLERLGVSAKGGPEVWGRVVATRLAEPFCRPSDADCERERTRCERIRESSTVRGRTSSGHQRCSSSQRLFCNHS